MIEMRWVKRWPKHMPPEANTLHGTQWQKERVLQYRVSQKQLVHRVVDDAGAIVSATMEQGRSDWQDVPEVESE